LHISLLLKSTKIQKRCKWWLCGSWWCEWCGSVVSDLIRTGGGTRSGFQDLDMGSIEGVKVRNGFGVFNDRNVCGGGAPFGGGGGGTSWSLSIFLYVFFLIH
ncbi:hypothetical protein M8C21_031277, partial [Ambrosia artemisiifolia]